MRYGLIVPSIIVAMLACGLTLPLWAAEPVPPAASSSSLSSPPATVMPTLAEPQSFETLTPLTPPDVPTAQPATAEPAPSASTITEAPDPTATPTVEAFQGRKVPNPGPTRAQCDPLKRKIQTLNQWPLVFHPLILPPRSILEWKHRRCQRTQSFREREFLESIPKP